MRILIINSEFPPIGAGAGNASANLARCLIEMDQEVMVLTSRYSDLPREENRRGMRIIRVPARRKRADRSMAYEQVSFILGGGLWALPLVRQWRPDIVLAFFGMPSGAIALLINWLFKVPYVVSLRGGDVPGFRPYDFARYHKIIGPILRLIWRHAGAIIANSGGLRSMAQLFDRTIPIQIIPNGVDPAYFTPPSREWNSPRLLFVGRVVYQKGVDLLLHALGNLKELPWELTVVGDGPQRSPLENLAFNLDIDDRVHFIGWKKNEALVAQYHCANVFTYPSRHEGMPNAVLEAMASGLPVIATDIAGNEELVIPGKTGLLVEPENQQDLEKALRKLIPNPQLRARMGASGRERIKEGFTWNQTSTQYLRVLERVYRGKKKRNP